jgi:TolA-binding protein
VALELAEVEFETGGNEGGGDSAKRLEVLLNKKPAPKVGLRRLALYRLGIVQFSRKNYQKSAQAFEEMLKDPAKNLIVSTAWQAGEARRQLALAANGGAQANEYKAALKNYETAMRVKLVAADADQARLQQQALLRVGQTKAAMELWADSQKSFEAFIAAHPKHELIRTAYLGLGWSCQNQENYPKAIESFENTVAGRVRDDVGARAQFLLGECYFEKKNFDKAITEFAKVESLYAFPQWQSKAAYEMAQALLRKENRDGARKQFERLIKRYPDTKAAAAAKAELKLIK